MAESVRKAFALMVAMALAASVFGCSPAEEPADEEPVAEGPRQGGTLNYYLSEPYFIDPLNAQEDQGMQVTNALFDSLVDFDYRTSELIPSVAESWETNDDATVWTFKLRSGVNFHNGRAVTAEDFKYAWERICNPDNLSEISYHLEAVAGYDEMQAGTATELEGVVAVDDSTLEVTLKYPFGDFEYVVGHPALGPVPREEVEADPEAFSEMPIGNGPFKMSEPWARDQYIKVERNDDYWGDAPYLDGIEFKIFKDEETAFLEFRQGNIDFMTIPSGQIRSSIAEFGESADGYTVEPGKQVLLGPELSTLYIVMNNDDQYLSNADLRKAISLAINREAISETVYEGTRTPATSIVPEGIVGWQANSWEWARYDVEEAKQKLADAGYPEGEGLPQLKLSFNTGAGHEPLMELIKSDLAVIGVDVEIDGMEWAQLLDNYDDGNFQLGRLGWLSDYPIMDNFLFPLFHSTAADNNSKYNNPEVDAALTEARQTVDDDERIADYQAIDEMIGADAPVAPVVMYRHRHIGSERVRDLVHSAMGFTSLEKVWLAE